METNKPQKIKKGNDIEGKNDIEIFKQDIILGIEGDKKNMYYRAVLAAALGSIPWIGGIYSSLISLQAESEQNKTNDLHKIWLLEHQEKIIILGDTLKKVISRLDEFSKAGEVEELILKRIQSKEYLNLVRETFKSWDEASTTEKREMFRRLITNAATIELCTDDMVRIFIKWIAQYHEYHILIMTEIYKNPGITLGAIWDNVFGKDGQERPRENSAEADLYRSFIHDLQLGGVIRQKREVNYKGQFLKKSRRSKSQSDVLKSSFDDEDEQELSELGGQFIHYVLEDVVSQISSGDKTE